jgi:inosine-uridine nucleoside N-ribohydrolase
VIDTDIGGDPDDAIALTLACASSEFDLLGVTIVDGDVLWRARIAAQLLGIAGRSDVPVVPGISSRGPAMMGIEGRGLLDHEWDGLKAKLADESAPQWLVNQSRQTPFHLVAIGPLTNLAAACLVDETFPSRLLSLTIMGGVYDETGFPAPWQQAIREHGMPAWPDYNTMVDSPAALTVAQVYPNITWVTSEVTHRIPILRRDRDRLETAGELGQALSRMIDSWYDGAFREQMLAGDNIADLPADAVSLLHDPLTLASLLPIRDDWLTLHDVPLRYAISDGVFRLYPTETEHGAMARVSTAASREDFAAFCVDRILRFATKPRRS